MNLKGLRILITAGPTWVALDKVRVISNTASGETGKILAEQLSRQKAKVTLLLGPGNACCIKPGIRVIPFRFFGELKRLLRSELKSNRYNCLVHAAAVSDYRPEKAFRGKIGSGLKRLRIDLVPTEKLIDRVKKDCPGLKLVGFKFQPAARKEALVKAGKELITHSKSDLVVANTVTRGKYRAYLLREEQVSGPFSDKLEMCRELVKLIGSCR